MLRALNRRPVSAAAAVIITAGIAVTALSSPAAADTAPQLYVGRVVYRGAQTNPVLAQHLVVHQRYTLSATVGTWPNGESSITDLSDDNGRIDDTLTVPYDTDPSTSSITVTLALADDPATPLVTKSPKISPPWLGYDSNTYACVGHTFQPATSDFPDATYTLASDYATFTPATVTANHGELTGLELTIAPDAPRRFPLTATTGTAPNQNTFTVRLRRGVPYADVVEPSNPWRYRIDAGCFAPNARVSIGKHSASIDVPKSLTSGAAGDATTSATLHPQPSALAVPAIALTGPYGQQAELAPFTLFGTTLRTGGALSASNSLLSSKPGYELKENACNPTVLAYGATGDPHAIWQARPGKRLSYGCTLRLRHNGTLALISHSRRVLWQTHAKGSSGGNRLLMRNNGAAAVVDAHGRTVWSTTAGRQRGGV